MKNPERSEKQHAWLGHFWVVNLIAVIYCYFFASGFWQKVSVLYLVVISLENNITNHYGAAKAAKAARIAEDTWWRRLIRRIT